MELIEKYDLIKQELLTAKGKNPFHIALSIMRKDYINMHGPEHHFLDGGAFLAAYVNAGGHLDLEAALETLKGRTMAMPGAMCGFWGVCGSVTSLGAAMSIIYETGPLSTDEHYRDNMTYTSNVINKMAAIGGPRCCKRNAFTSISEAVKRINEKENLTMELTTIKCGFYKKNPSCIEARCPYYPTLAR